MVPNGQVVLEEKIFIQFFPEFTIFSNEEFAYQTRQYRSQYLASLQPTKTELDTLNRELPRTSTPSPKFQKKTQASIIHMKNIVPPLPSRTTGTRSAMQQEYHTQPHSNGQNALAIRDSRSGYHEHQISGVKWQSGT